MRKYFFIAVIHLVLFKASAQDIQYSQFYANPLYLNPAFAGTADLARVNINNRILWPNLPQAFTSYSASFDYQAVKLNSGFGLMFNTDAQGSASLQQTTAAAIYSYEISFKNKLIIRPALQFGYVFRSIDQSKLIFGDQVDFGIDGAPTLDPNAGAINLKNYWDIGTGFLAYTKTYWLGFSAAHITQPNISILEGSDALAIRYSLHAGGRFPIGKTVWNPGVNSSIAPSILYKRQGNFQQLDVGASMYLKPVIVGLYYRGIPLVQSDFNEANHEAIIFQIGFEYRGFELGYSYDFNLSQFDPVSGGGAHEVALQYVFRFPHNPTKTPKSAKKVRCPAFSAERLYN